MLTRDRITLANNALAEIPAGPIVDWDENSLEAREVRRAWGGVWADTLAHPWWFSGALASLAGVANDREQEWRFAYALPQNFAHMRAISSRGVIGRSRTGYRSIVGMWTSYEIVGRTLYANEPHIVIEYSRNDVTEAELPPLVARSFELLLAMRLCMPIAKSSSRRAELRQEYELERQRAMAWDMGQTGQLYMTGSPATDAAWNAGDFISYGYQPWIAYPAVTGL